MDRICHWITTLIFQSSGRHKHTDTQWEYDKTQNRLVTIKSDSTIKDIKGNQAVLCMCVRLSLCVCVCLWITEVLICASQRIIPLISYIIWIPIRPQMSGLKSSHGDYSTFVWAGTDCALCAGPCFNNPNPSPTLHHHPLPQALSLHFMASWDWGVGHQRRETVNEQSWQTRTES